MNTDSTDEHDERFAREAARVLRQGAEELDAGTLARLKSVRQQALAGAGDPRTHPALGWRPAAGIAAACATALLAFGLWVGSPGHGPSGPATPVSAQAGSPAGLEVMLADDDDLELIEDLEFYDWLAPDPEAPEANPGLSG